jgi:hypothetical protein
MATSKDSFERPQNENIKINNCGGRKNYGGETERWKIYKREWIILLSQDDPF